MIDDMTSLKRAMQQMDAEDPTVAQTAKDHAAQILGEANLNFSKMAELIERRRLLLRPAIVARIKRMDQPGMLGDAAFRDTGSALRKEGQSFLQIAEAIEASDRAAPRQIEPIQPVAESEPLFPVASEPDAPGWLMTLILAWGFVSFPFRHPLRSLAVALFALVLLYAVRGAIVLGQQASTYVDGSAAVHRVDTAIASVSSFINEQILRRPRQAAPAPTPTPSPTTAAAMPSPSPSAAPATPSATPSGAPAASTPSAAPSAAAAAPPSATASAPQANELAPPAPSSAAPALPPAAPLAPPASTPRREARTAPPARPATSCGHYSSSDRCAPFDDYRFADSQPRNFESMMPEAFRRNSRSAGPCRGGVGGCYWGGVRF
jgi:hypothetical protein